MTRLEFLEDTIKYYSEDTSRRCLDGGFCLYSPINACNNNSEGCAIGRHLTPKLQLLLDKTENNSSVGNGKVFKKLPKWMRELGQDFLSDMQELHDEEYNWDEGGLTELGKERVQEIKSEYNL